MATTLVIAVIFDDQIVLGNLGDSKAFLLHDQVLTQISCDHNLKNELVRAGTMSQAEAERLPSSQYVSAPVPCRTACRPTLSTDMSLTRSIDDSPRKPSGSRCGLVSEPTG